MADTPEIGPVRVGVRRWAGDQPAEPGEPASGLIGPAWLEVGGHRIPGDVLVQASHHFDGAGEDDGGGKGIGVVTVQLLCSDYVLVDHVTGEPVTR